MAIACNFLTFYLQWFDLLYLIIYLAFYVLHSNINCASEVSVQ